MCIVSVCIMCVCVCVRVCVCVCVVFVCVCDVSACVYRGVGAAWYGIRGLRPHEVRHRAMWAGARAR
jgi:hypothetical protein